MGDLDDCNAQSLMQFGNLDPRLHPPFGAKVRLRRVKQKDIGFADNCATNGDAFDLCVNPGLWTMRHAQAKAHILGHGHIRIKP